MVTDAEGDAVAYTSALNGNIRSVTYVKPAEGGFADGVDFTIVTNTTAVTVWTESDVNASKVVLPQIAASSNVGVAISYAENFPIYVPIGVCDEQIKITVANGGDAGNGTFIFVVEGVAY
ncbi:MAG: hypothetical protein EOM14_10160 [Clostridia bacterium]|nr:hypothetical protein [Clostridia bacterium]